MKKFNKDKYLKKLKLKRFWQNNSRYFYIGIPCILCLLLGIYFTYSKFFVSSEEDVARTTVGEFIYGDIIMIPYVDGQYSSTFPEKKTGINVEKVVCDNDVTASWDDDKWGLYATNLSKRTKCSVYFVTPASCGINDNVSCINSREGLTTLANEVNNGDSKSGKIIYLTSDLDLGGKFDSDGNALDGNISWTPIGTNSNPFSGTFDGNGHIISNMYVNDNEKTGIFNFVLYGEIKNLGIENSYILTQSSLAAGIVGQLKNGEISNCYNAATVSGEGAGGIVNFTDNSNIKNCYNIGIINGNSKQFSGGIVDYFGNSNNKSIIRNVYNTGEVSCKINAAGIAGGLQGIIENSYNFGAVNGDYCSGGTAGQMFTYTYPIIKNSYNVAKSSGGGIAGCPYESYEYKLNNNYYLKDTADYGFYYFKSDEGAEPLSQDEMPNVMSVINGDNAFVEDTNNINNGYPILKWQAERENN
mgnify:CR=1 FL=1